MATWAERHDLIIRASSDVGFQKDIVRACTADILLWFDYFAYTFNPRATVSVLPFNLYPFQKKLVLALRECIDTGESLMIEKSRDMGVSWIVMLVFQWYWLFYEGSDVHVGSSKREYVDKLGVKSTLIEKFRFNLSYIPKWMCPPLKKYRDDSLAKIKNPGNGNTLTGEAAVPSFGMSQRYRAVLMDELARQPYGRIAYETVSQTTDCIIGVWTPFGKANIAAEFARNRAIEEIDMTGE